MSASNRPDDDRLLSPKEVAAMVRISLRTLWRLLSGRKFPRPVYVGKSPRWWRSVIIGWLDEGCPPQSYDQE